uniref:CCDC92 domain-containing protein n=1 Tax=Macrostomum lignano TaxID=282301 RepID=A0A1I8F4P4_9PLAT
TRQRLMQVIEEEREILDATRRENYQLRAKVELDGQDIQGLEGRLGELEASAGRIEGRKCRAGQAADRGRGHHSEQACRRRAAARAPSRRARPSPKQRQRQKKSAAETAAARRSGGHRGGRPRELPDDWLEGPDRQPGQRLTAAKVAAGRRRGDRRSRQSGDEFVLVCTPRQQAAASRSGGGGLSMRRYPEDQRSRSGERLSGQGAHSWPGAQAKIWRGGVAAAPWQTKRPRGCRRSHSRRRPQQPSVEPQQQQQQQQVANASKAHRPLRTQVAPAATQRRQWKRQWRWWQRRRSSQRQSSEHNNSEPRWTLSAAPQPARTAVGGPAAAPSARPSSRASGVPRLNLDFATRDGAEQQQSGADSVRDFLESRELTASARRYADQLIDRKEPNFRPKQGLRQGIL